ncbi:MAG: hypothetical protein HY706_17420 [Candidatus Hydrogenedentes bacterium]|nr:hypothetical protein [Candidatus Hydrogenedentota bacterium]
MSEANTRVPVGETIEKNPPRGQTSHNQICFHRIFPAGHKLRILLPLLVIAIPVLSPNTSAQESPDQRAEAMKLLGVLAAVQQENRARVKSFSATIAETWKFYTTRQGTTEHFDRQATLKEKMKGGFICAQRVEKDTITGPNPRTVERQARLVVNDQYIAEWDARNPVVRLIDYDRQTGMPVLTRRSYRTIFPRDVLSYGFGDGELTLQGIYDHLSKEQEMNLSVEKGAAQDEKDVYRVKIYDKSSEQPFEELTVDTGKGALITRAVMFSGSKITQEMKVLAKEAAPSVWFPVVWEEVIYTKSKETGDLVERTRSRCEIKDLEVNQEIPDEQFTWKGLDLRPETQIIRVDRSGAERIMVVVNGELVPEGGASPEAAPDK